MSRGAWGKASLVSLGVCALGYALLKLTTPSDDELYNSLAPDLRRQVDTRRMARERAGQVNAALTSNPDDSKPVWAGDKANSNAK